MGILTDRGTSLAGQKLDSGSQNLLFCLALASVNRGKYYQTYSINNILRLINKIIGLPSSRKIEVRLRLVA